MDYEQIDRIEMKQLDVSNTNQEGRKSVEDDLNSFIKSFEDNGYQIVGEDFMPQLNGVRAIVNIYFEKRASVVSTKYLYAILDSRNGYGVTSKMVNEEVLKLKKDGNKIVRKLFVPMRNDAFVQLLLAYIPSNKKPIKEKPVEVVEDVREEKSSEAISA